MVTRGLPDSFVLLGSMRPDSVLTALPDQARCVLGDRVLSGDEGRSRSLS
jgi:hypothetical protein